MFLHMITDLDFFNWQILKLIEKFVIDLKYLFSSGKLDFEILESNFLMLWLWVFNFKLKYHASVKLNVSFIYGLSIVFMRFWKWLYEQRVWDDTWVTPNNGLIQEPCFQICMSSK